MLSGPSQNKFANKPWSGIHSVITTSKPWVSEREARIKNTVRFQWLHLQLYSLYVTLYNRFTLVFGNQISVFGEKGKKRNRKIASCFPISHLLVWYISEYFVNFLQADFVRMNSCKEIFPKGNIWDLNHKEERNQLFNAYYFHTCWVKNPMCFACTLQITHWVSKGLSDLSKSNSW